MLTSCRIITGQQVMLTALFERNVLDIVIMPRHLLDKYTIMFTNGFEKEDRADPARHDKILDFSMNDLWKSYFPEILEDIDAMHAEWNMLKLFFKWMFFGKIVEAPGMDLEDVSWRPTCSALFTADVASWVRDHDGLTRQAPIA